VKILVDTCIWSLALRRNHNRPDPAVDELQELVNEYRVQMIGPIRQEILSGIKSDAQFEKLREILRAFPDFRLTSDDYECAARLFNLCRGKGLQGSNTDFLICAVAVRHGLPIFTKDNDFKLYQKHIKLEIHQTIR